MKFIWLLILLFVFVPNVQAQSNKFITVVNPVRISTYSTSPVESLKTQYSQVKQRGLVATWLFTYDALDFSGLSLVAKDFNNFQEKGVFLEVTPQLADEARVGYPKVDSWHRANAVFLSGYSLTDRKKLIDKVLDKFRTSFGYYPKSVGAWWVDEYSLSYLRDKYGIDAVLVCSDQFSTDGYQIWGQFWSTPFYPSKNHSGVPAQKNEDKIGVVAIQWAARDPLNGYLTPSEYRASLYSTQDYFTLGLSPKYQEILARVYLDNPQNKFGQITFGLEGDFMPGAYLSGNYIAQLDLAKKLQSEGVKVVTMSEFANWYKSSFEISPAHIIEIEDPLESKKKAIWYQTPFYRAGIVIDNFTNELQIVDLRVYDPNYRSPYFETKNYFPDLEINIPSVIDSASWSEDTIDFPGLMTTFGDLEEKKFQFDDGREITLRPDKIIGIDINNQNLSPIKVFYISQDFLQYVTAKKVILVIYIMALVLFGLGWFIFIRKISWKVGSIILLLIILIAEIYYQRIFQIYTIGGEEMAALSKLQKLDGKVLVLNQRCGNCRIEAEYQPLTLTGNKLYVAMLAKKAIVDGKGIIATVETKDTLESQKSRTELKNALIESGASFIYLVKYGNYIEKLPFSPGDLGVEKIFNNANTEIWKVVVN